MMQLRGRVQSGKGDASDWLRLFANAYENRIGSPVFPGSLNLNLGSDFDWYGKPKDPVPAVGLEIPPEHQAALLSVSSHCSKNNPGERPLSDPWGRSTLYS